MLTAEEEDGQAESSELTDSREGMPTVEAMSESIWDCMM